MKFSLYQTKERKTSDLLARHDANAVIFFFQVHILGIGVNCQKYIAIKAHFHGSGVIICLIASFLTLRTGVKVKI